MCGGIGMGFYPDETGLVISELEPGDEVLINYTDDNSQTRQKVAIIWQVEGFSALTTNGETLSCGQGIAVIPTGNNYKKYTVARDAREKLREVEERHKYENFDPEPE